MHHSFLSGPHVVFFSLNPALFSSSATIRHIFLTKISFHPSLLCSMIYIYDIFQIAITTRISRALSKMARGGWDPRGLRGGLSRAIPHKLRDSWRRAGPARLRRRSCTPLLEGPGFERERGRDLCGWEGEENEGVGCCGAYIFYGFLCGWVGPVDLPQLIEAGLL